MELCYATTNEGKIASLQREFDKYGWKVKPVNIDIPEPRTSDVKEIAHHKAIYAFNIIKEPLVVLDAGFYIDSLNGFPRAFVNFALETVGIEGILKLVEDKDRGCEFRHCLAYIDGKTAEPEYFQSRVRGTIAPEPRGDLQEHLWSRLSTIFIPAGHENTLAQMTKPEYFGWKEKTDTKNSHHSAFAAWLYQKNQNSAS
jgi:XTP/dITP diphosphohydrolase